MRRFTGHSCFNWQPLLWMHCWKRLKLTGNTDLGLSRVNCKCIFAPHCRISRSCRKLTENPLKWTINDALKGMQHQFFALSKLRTDLYTKRIFLWKEIITKFSYQKWRHLLLFSSFFYMLWRAAKKEKKKNSRRSSTLRYRTIIIYNAVENVLNKYVHCTCIQRNIFIYFITYRNISLPAVQFV